VNYATQKQYIIERAKAIKARLEELHTKMSHGDESVVDEANRLTDEGRQLTRRYQEVIDNESLAQSIDQLGTQVQVRGGSLAAKARTKNLLAGEKVSFPAKAIISVVGDASPARESGIARMPLDRRFIYPNLETVDLPEGATRVEYLRQSARTFASVSEMQMALTGSGTKPETTTSVELTDDEPLMIAHTSELLPNAIVKLSAFTDLIDDTMRLGYQRALEDYVVDTLVLEAGTVDDTGADLFQKVRKAVTNLQGLGFAPDAVFVSAADAETLDLSRSGGSTSSDGPFILSPAPRDLASSPLWGLKVVASPSITDPLVADTSALGRLYVGPVELAVDPFEGFKSNQSRFRFEGPALTVVQQADAIHRVAAA
jgi:hypothetical protein